MSCTDWRYNAISCKNNMSLVTQSNDHFGYTGNMSRRHEFSQHFLRSPRLAGTLVGHSTIKAHDTVVDIGAGSGVITSVLARRAKTVFAVEPEPKSLMKLRRNVAGIDTVHVVGVSFEQFELPGVDYKVFANIPFSQSAAIVWRLTHEKRAPQAIYVIVQKQFANKLLPDSDGFSSQLGMMIAPWWKARIRFRLKKSDFTPPPAVDTVLLELLPVAAPRIAPGKRDVYEKYIQQGFTDQALFHSYGFGDTIKPSSLTAADWQRLFIEKM